jgi:hypothetical protein
MRAGLKPGTYTRRRLGGFGEGDFGGVAEGVEDAEEKIRGNVLGVAV